MSRYVPPVLAEEGFQLSRRFGDRSACFLYNGQRICPPHTGDDYARGVRGGRAVAQHRGKIVYKGGVGDKTAEHPQGMGGYGVIVDFGEGYRQLVAHCVWNSCPFPVGATVEPGTVIATIDSSGTSTGDHLHNELLKDGRPIDPAPFLAAGSLPIASGGSDMPIVTGYSHIHNRRGSLVQNAHFRVGPTRAAESLAIFPGGEVLIPFGVTSDGEDVGGNSNWYACTMWVPGIGKSVVGGFFHSSVVSALEPIERVTVTDPGAVEAARAQGFITGRDKAAAAASSVTP